MKTASPMVRSRLASFGISRNSGSTAPGRRIPTTSFRLLSSSATYVVLWVTIGDQADPSIWSRMEDPDSAIFLEGNPDSLSYPTPCASRPSVRH